MTRVEREGEDWTRQKVEAGLIAAFRAMPALPVFAPGGARLPVVDGDGHTIGITMAMGWAAFLEHDAGARKYLWAWARCQATGDSFGALCRAIGWPRATAEKGRRRAAATIAARLMTRGA